jgi:hypothetical protein
MRSIRSGYKNQLDRTMKLRTSASINSMSIAVKRPGDDCFGDVLGVWAWNDLGQASRCATKLFRSAKTNIYSQPQISETSKTAIFVHNTRK